MSEHLTKLKMIVKLNGWEKEYIGIYSEKSGCKFALNSLVKLVSPHLIEKHELCCKFCASYRVKNI